MAKKINRLSALDVGRKKEKGLYPDGGNLYLQVTSSGSKSWLFRFMLNGKAREMGLGSCNTITLAEARELAIAARKAVSSNVDPIVARKDERYKARLQAEKAKTFKQCAEAYIESHKAGWRNAKHASQWTNTLKTYVYPVFGDIKMQDIDIELVQKVLTPIWSTKTETATRIRGRIEVIFDWAITSDKDLKIENPARWKGGLKNLLPKPSKVQKVKHHPALPYNLVAEFMASLSTVEDITARALELTILTASRTSEVRGARWEEFDLNKKIWIVPATRIKTEKEHRIPLSPAAISILKELDKHRNNPFVFPGRNPTKCMSDMALLALTRRMKRADWPHFTVHGFRSTFRDWAAEQTNFPREVCEMCLSHAVSDEVEAAYMRSDLFEKRKLLMDTWARYCYQPITQGNKVVAGKFSKGA